MRSRFADIISLVFLPVLVSAQPHILRYRPEGTDFTIVGGTHRFNRALYGTNTAARVEAGDLPEFALYMPGMGGNLSFFLIRGAATCPLTRARYIKAAYRPGSIRYEIRDPLLGSGTLQLTVLALADAEGLVIRFGGDGIDSKTLVMARFGGASGKKFSRDGDLGADPESCFDLDSSVGGRYTIDGDVFRLVYAGGKRLEGLFPAAITGNGNILCSQFSVATPQYLLIRNPASAKTSLSVADLQPDFDTAEAVRRTLAARVELHTPDDYLNTLGGALAVAADGIWEAPTYLHGAVAWRQRLPAWRGPYVADLLGWHDRARQHFSSYALSQLTMPETGPVVADTALLFARQLEKLGTSLFSSGYICRNPNGDFRPHHYDMNLVYIDQLLTHFYWTGDTAYVRQMWPVLRRHLAWEKRNFDADGDGLYDAYACIWASDALEYGGGGVTHSSAYNYRANLLAADLARLIGEDPTPYAREASHILNAINARLWLPGKGSYAEYIDWPDGSSFKPMVHPAAGLWTIYGVIDAGVADAFQAWRALQYIDTDIPHIPIRAAGLDDTTLYTVSTTNWQPYTWSLNNVALAESLNTALAFWQGGRPDEAFRLWRSSLIESMYLGSSPGNFEQLSSYDFARGELYRDFADPIGMAARSLVEGLFGIHPDALHDTLTITPGWPQSWAYASLHIPDISIDYSRDHYKIRSAFGGRMCLRLRLRARSADVRSVTVNGRGVRFTNIDDAIGGPMVEVVVGAEAFWDLHVVWGSVSIHGDSVGNRGMFERLRQGRFRWWEPRGMGGVSRADSGAVSGADSGRVLGDVSGRVLGDVLGHGEAVSLEGFFNASVTDIFKNRYLAPRPVTPTLQLPTQGVGNWCYPLVTADIEDAGLRAAGSVTLPNGIVLMTPRSGANIVFTSRWSNYPDSVAIPLSGHASHGWFMLAGTTNPMQSRITNGLITVSYKDASADTLALVNPSTWWPIEEDYYENGLAFTTGAPHPLRVYLKTGVVSDKPGKWTSIRGLTNTAIDGGAATVLDMPLDSQKELDHLVIRTVARDVVVGLMSISLNKIK